jgi:hypothetical protein
MALTLRGCDAVDEIPDGLAFHCEVGFVAGQRVIEDRDGAPRRCAVQIREVERLLFAGINDNRNCRVGVHQN